MSGPDESSTSQALEDELLGGRREFNRDEVADLAGVPLERARRLWVAMGFAESEDHQAVMFTWGDVHALRSLAALVAEGVIDPAAEVAVTRAMGQALSRLAEWQVAMVTPQMTNSAHSVVPTMAALQSYVWRRHLAAAAGRALLAPGEALTRRTLVVGFADLVGYTSLTRRLEVVELTELLERFESAAMSAVALGHGWVVKTVGDEVMFAIEDPAAAARIALDLHQRVVTDAELPGIRVGMAYGEVLVRFGDAYGSVVNLAARLTAAARPDTVLVNRDLATALATEPGCVLRPLRSRRVRGFHRLTPFTLRRAAP